MAGARRDDKLVDEPHKAKSLPTVESWGIASTARAQSTLVLGTVAYPEEYTQNPEGKTAGSDDESK